MTLDERLGHIANAVERILRQELKPADESYHRVFLKELGRILIRRGQKRP
jgi:hypothetical protein